MQGKKFHSYVPNAALAQSVEHRSRKAKVVGSIPVGGSITCSNKAAQERVIDFIPQDLPQLLLIHRV